MNVHGKDHQTFILRACESKEELSIWGLYYSELWNVVESPEWANLKPEIGDGGSPWYARIGKRHSEESKLKISISKKGKKIRSSPKSLKHKAKMRKPKSDAAKQNMKLNHARPTAGTIWVNNGYEQKLAFEVESGWSKGMLVKPEPPSQKGKFWITNGITNRMTADYVPDGWTKGKTRKVKP